ncbi:4181_t:CDS:2, partial [Cetraspora pellucida]
QIQIKEASLRSELAIDYEDISKFVHNSLISLEGSNDNYESDTLEFYMNFDVYLENKESTKYEELNYENNFVLNSDDNKENSDEE